MALSIYHVSGTTKETPYSTDTIPFTIGVCADGKTDAARIVRERVLTSGYESFTWSNTERICSAGEWEPGQTLWYQGARDQVRRQGTMEYATRIEKLNNGSWARVGDGSRVYVTGPNDTTAGELHPYEPGCSLCWLGFGHSGDLHRAKLSTQYAALILRAYVFGGWWRWTRGASI